MDVDRAPISTEPQLEKEEKKPEEPMDHEENAPQVLSQESEKEAVVPPIKESVTKVNAIVPKSQKAAEGVLESKSDGQSYSSK